MPGTLKKKASDSIPFCKDQGMDYLAGAGKAGTSIQYKSGWVMVSGGVFVFADQGLQDMDITNGTYAVLIQNHTDPADEATVAENAKLNTQLTIVGPDDDDVLDIVIIGTLKSQLS